MTSIEVRDETRINGRLARHIERILADAAPAIEHITELPLPTLVFRLLTPWAYSQEITAYVDRQLKHSLAGTPVSPREQAEADHCREKWRRQTGWTWMMSNGMTVTTADGQPQTLIAPRALHHTGLRHTRQGLPRFITHESIHHAQMAFSHGAVVPVPMRVRHHPHDDRAVRPVMEGHADWAEVQISSAIFGTLEEETLRRSWRWHQQKRLLPRINRFNTIRAHVRAGQPIPPPPPKPTAKPQQNPRAIEIHTRGQEFVEATIAHAGAGRWNKLWTSPDLVPTADELTEPHDWLRRVGL